MRFSKHALGSGATVPLDDSVGFEDGSIRNSNETANIQQHKMMPTLV